MEIQLIRNATLKMTMADHTFMIDPYLSAKHGMPSYTGTSPNPLVELPFTPEIVLGGVEMVVISHIHSDHFDPTAQKLLPKVIPIICQPGDELQLRDMGFTSAVPVERNTEWNNITITRTQAQHGSGSVLDEMGQASGFLFTAENEPTIYWAGDTVWNPKIEGVIQLIKPDVIITHSGGAVWGDNVPIIMDDRQTIAVCEASPGSMVIATHMEALDHCRVSRTMLRTSADQAGISHTKLRIPADGESILITSSSIKVK